MSYDTFIHQKAIALGKDILRMTTAAGSGHPTSSLSILHMVAVLMYDVMRYEPADPWHPGNDRLVLSEGHAVPAIYAAFADLGGAIGKERVGARRLTTADLASLRETDSVLDGHPNPAEGFPFFDAATGSLGQGLSVAAGLALAARQRNIDKRIYAIIGDGESREGQIWEAMDFIADHRLSNVVALFNCNGQGQADHVSPQQSPEALEAKALAFGWHTLVIDGHSPSAIKEALSNVRPDGPPLAIIARTTKGWGCPAIHDRSNHGKPVPANQLDAACAELDATAAKLKLPAAPAEPIRPSAPPAADALERRAIVPAPFAEAMSRAGLDGAMAKNQLATRRAYGAALLALAEADERIVALDGDVSNSTFSEMLAHKKPERFFECKIAEQNMISAAAGLAAAGFIPFASTFAKFLSRGYDQIEMAQITRANIKLVGSHAGISLAADGPSQMSLHDVAYFRSAGLTDNGHGRPACVTFHPADAVAAYQCTVLAANHDGMCYIRTHRPDVGMIYKPGARFELGGSQLLCEGSALTIVSAGYMLHICKETVDRLAEAGLRCTLIDAYSFPLKPDAILAAAKKAGSTILCVEDNYVGGLASAVAEAAAMAGGIRVESMFCRRIPKSAKTPADILNYVGLSSKHIESRIRSLAG